MGPSNSLTADGLATGNAPANAFAAAAPSAYSAEPASASSAVSWGAIFAGAAAAAALSLILLILGTGLGLSSVSPWSREGITATTFGISTVVWLTFTQLVASGMGGYLAGRLRTKWISVHTDEVYFRDTAHGFLAWAVASLVTAAMLGSVVGAIVGGGVQAGASVVSGVASAAVAGTGAATVAGAQTARSDDGVGPMGYIVDSLFRKAAGVPAAAPGAPSQPDSAARSTAAQASEITRIFANSIRTGKLPADDVQYAGELISERTGISQADAEKRVTDAYNTAQAKLREAETAARDAANTARKTSAYAALWLFVSLLAGAFVASLCATYGGRQRDL